MSAHKNMRSERLDIRLSQPAKMLLQEAAQIKHKNMSEFVLESALTVAEKTVMERRVFMLDADQWKAFSQALDKPASPSPRMTKLLQEKSVFE